jgi:ankyrin repeat-rich membrane spanning protein
MYKPSHDGSSLHTYIQEAKTIDGDTPLLRAVRQRNTVVVEMLLEKKAKISAADVKGDTALHIAMRAR